MHQIMPQVFTFDGLFAGRVYLLVDDDGLTLVDASISIAGNKILSQLKQAGYQPSDVKRILITHAHPDHIGSLPMLQKATGAEVWCHALEKPVIEGTQAIATRAEGFHPPETRFPATPVARTLNDQEILPILGGLQVIWTPGHAPGHLAFWQAERKMLITGDTIFYMLNRMTLPFAFLTVDMPENKRALQKLYALKPETLLFGHGNPIVGNALPQMEAFLNRIGVI